MMNNYFTPYPTETDLLETSERHEGSDYTESLPQEGLAEFDPAAFQVRLLATRPIEHWVVSISFLHIGKVAFAPSKKSRTIPFPCRKLVCYQRFEPSFPLSPE